MSLLKIMNSKHNIIVAPLSFSHLFIPTCITNFISNDAFWYRARVRVVLYFLAISPHGRLPTLVDFCQKETKESADYPHWRITRTQSKIKLGKCDGAS